MAKVLTVVPGQGTPVLRADIVKLVSMDGNQFCAAARDGILRMFRVETKGGSDATDESVWNPCADEMFCFFLLVRSRWSGGARGDADEAHRVWPLVGRVDVA